MTQDRDIPGRTASYSHVVVEREAEAGGVKLSNVVDERHQAMERLAEALEAGVNVHLTEEGTFELDGEAEEKDDVQ